MLEGLWQEGFMAIAAIGATNIGSIEVILLLLKVDKSMSVKFSFLVFYLINVILETLKSSFLYLVPL